MINEQRRSSGGGDSGDLRVKLSRTGGAIDPATPLPLPPPRTHIERPSLGTRGWRGGRQFRLRLRDGVVVTIHQAAPRLAFCPAIKTAYGESYAHTGFMPHNSLARVMPIMHQVRTPARVVPTWCQSPGWLHPRAPSPGQI
jgi:hypothetical protein